MSELFKAMVNAPPKEENRKEAADRMLDAMSNKLKTASNYNYIRKCEMLMAHLHASNVYYWLLPLARDRDEMQRLMVVMEANYKALDTADKSVAMIAGMFDQGDF